MSVDLSKLISFLEVPFYRRAVLQLIGHHKRMLDVKRLTLRLVVVQLLMILWVDGHAAGLGVDFVEGLVGLLLGRGFGKD